MYRPSHAVTIANRLVTLALALALFAAIGGLIYGLRQDSLDLPLQISPEHVRGLPANTEVTDWGTVRFTLTDPSTKQLVLRTAEQLAPLLLLIPGLFLLRAFLQAVLAGNPFGDANARRLRTIALLLLVGAPLLSLIQLALRNALFNTIETDLASEGGALPGGAILAGLAVLVLAEVFAYGVRLREDVEATV